VLKVERTYRTITSANADQLKALAEISMLGNGYSLSDKACWDETYRWFGREFGEFNPETKVFLVALRDQKIIGFARFQRQAETGTWWVQGLEVRAEEQGHGVGTAMLSRGLTMLRQRGASIVVSYTSKKNARSLAAHRKAGFAIITDDFNRFDGTPIGHRDSWMLTAELHQKGLDSAVQ
jgi:RimJ/RimL family protein N-acetyltransferase